MKAREILTKLQGGRIYGIYEIYVFVPHALR